MRPLIALALVVTVWSAVVDVEARAEPASTVPAQTAAAYVADGRAPLEQMMQRFHELDSKHGWNVETLYAYPDAPETQMKAWHTGTPGPALWVLSGIHGADPAGK